MKAFSRPTSLKFVLLCAAALALLPGCSKSDQASSNSTPSTTSATPSAPAAPAVGQSKTSAVIASHLESGGEFYAIVDVKGELEKLGNATAGMMNSMMQQAAAGGAPMPVASLDFKTLFGRLGFYNVDGLGLSSWQDADGLHHNRAFLYTPGGRAGLLKIFGGAPQSFISPTLAPADADFVLEGTLDLKSAAELIISYVKDVGGANAAKQVADTLNAPLAPGTTTTFTGQNLIDHLNTTVTVIARADTQHLIPLSPQYKMPTIDAVIALDGFSDVFDQFQTAFTGAPFFKFSEANGMKIMSVDTEIPAPFDVYQPQLISDPKTKRLYLVSRSSFADETINGKGPRLSSSADFKTAIDGLPDKGNFLSYISKKGAAAFVQYYSAQMMQTLPPDAQKSMMEFNTLQNIPHGLASVDVNLADGIFAQGESTQSYKNVVLVAPVMAVGLVSAMAIPAFAKVREQSREKAITNNLRIIASAAQTYMLDKGVTSASYQDIVGPGADKYIRAITPVMGEDYTGIVVRQNSTQISVTTPDGQVITFNL
jgi:competence protein ComGC